MESQYIDINEIQSKDVFELSKEIVICPLCNGILMNPQQCSSCTNSYCFHCLNKWLEKNKVCPGNCSKYKIQNAPKSVTLLLSKLIFKGNVSYDNKIKQLIFPSNTLEINTQNNQLSFSQTQPQPQGEQRINPQIQSQYLSKTVNQMQLGNDMSNKSIVKKVINRFNTNARQRKKEKYFDGNEYDGEFLDGKRDGYGVYKWVSGQLYEGSFKNDKMNGKGKMSYPDGNTYEGDWLDDKREGFGVYNCPDGRRYEGTFHNDVLEGKGTMYYENGDIFQGEWVNDAMEGYGVYKWHDNRIYEGQYVNGIEHGKGKMTYSSGDIYEGDFVNGNCEGKGIYTWIDGTRYEGEWSDNKKHGNGKIILPNCQIQYGRWENDIEQK